MLVTRDDAIRAYVMSMSKSDMYHLVWLYDEFKSYRWYPQECLDVLLKGYKPSEVVNMLAPDFERSQLFVRFNSHGFIESDDGYKKDNEMETLRPRMVEYLQKTHAKTYINALDSIINAFESVVFNVKFIKADIR